MQRALRVAAILIAAAVLLCAALGRADLFTPDEPREAEIARETWSQGDLVVPRLNGEPSLARPPLLHWLVAAAYRVAGGPGESAARAVPALAGILCVLMTYLFGRGIVGERAALIASLVLLSSFQFIWIARRCVVDIPLTCAVLLACGALHHAVVRGGRFRIGWLAVGYIATAAAVLFNGLAGAAAPALAVAGTIVARRDWRGVWRHGLVPGAVVAILPAGIWFGRLHDRIGAEAAHQFSWVGAVAGHENPFYYYLPAIMLEFAPWSVILPFGIVSAWFSARAGRSFEENGSLVYLLSWFILPFLLLSASGSKRAVFLLPIFPAAALLVGWWLARPVVEMHATERPVPGTQARMVRIGSALLFGATIGLGAGFISVLSLIRPADWASAVASAVLFTPLAIIAYRALRAGQTFRLGVVAAGITCLVYLGIVTQVAPEVVNDRISVRTTATQLRRMVAAADRVAFYDFTEEMLGGYLFYSRLTFPNLDHPEQLRRHLGDEVIDLRRPRPFALIRASDYEEIAPALGVETEVVRRYRSPTWKDESAPGDDLYLIVRRPGDRMGSDL